MVHNQHHVVSFRVLWRDVSEVQSNWERIAGFRNHCDSIIQRCPGVKCFFSSITGTFNKASGKMFFSKNARDNPVFPGISYWVVLEEGQVEAGPNIKHLLKKECPLASVKDVVTKNARTRLDALNSSIFACLKDCNSTFVKKKVEESVALCEITDDPVVTYVICEASFQDNIKPLLPIFTRAGLIHSFKMFSHPD